MEEKPKPEPPPFIRRLKLKDYKSIARCDIPLQRLNAFIGPNGSGKSNLVDSLRFVADALRNSLEFALRDRGGVAEVRRRSRGHPRFFGIALDMVLPGGEEAYFAFVVGAARAGAFSVSEEFCQVSEAGRPHERHHYRVREGQLASASRPLQSVIEPDRLYLQAVSAVPSFRPVYDALTRMGFYNLNPQAMRDLQSPDPAQVLARNGGNIASILKRLGAADPGIKSRIEQYLKVVVPGIRTVSPKPIGPKETIEFRQEVPGDDNPWSFLAANMSDGTLRVLGVLVALFQGSPGLERPAPLVAVEEPESALHPAAVNALAGAIVEASAHTQVLVTSHSPELLDNPEIDSESILAVVSEKGETIVGPVDEKAKTVLRDRLYTPGELLRIQQIEPDRSLFRRNAKQFKLFPREVSP